MNRYLLNAFSLQMLTGTYANVEIREVYSLPDGLISAVGHQDTANVLGVECARLNVELKEGDIAYVAQLVGGRLPEGTKVLPSGFKFKYYRVEILKSKNEIGIWQCPNCNTQYPTYFTYCPQCGCYPNN